MQFHLVLSAALSLALIASSHVLCFGDALSKPIEATKRFEVRTRSSRQACFSFEELYSLQEALWENFLFPANVKQAKGINSTYFAPNVEGRVDLTRTFTGQELNTEYFFGLFANLGLNPSAISLLGVPISYQIQKFTGNENIGTASTKIMFNATSLNIVLPVVIDTWIVWNANKQVLQYDAVFKWWQWAVDELILEAAPKIGATTAVEAIGILTNELATSVCATASTYCNGTNMQYNSTAECHDFLTKGIRFGEAYELGRNTLLCRMLHQNMVPYRPAVHCPHIGPSGGGYCNDDKTYQGTVNEAYFTNSRWIPTDP